MILNIPVQQKKVHLVGQVKSEINSVPIIKKIIGNRDLIKLYFQKHSYTFQKLDIIGKLQQSFNSRQYVLFLYWLPYVLKRLER